MENTTLINSAAPKKERNYGIDLLRLISMLMVVILHVLGYGGALGSVENLTLKGELLWGLEILCFGAVNMYAIISGYVGYKSSHKWSNIIYLCLQTAFFAVILTGIDLVILIRAGAEIEFKYVFLNLFPTIRGLWYISAYFCLFFFMPLLDKLIDVLDRKTLKTLALFIFVVFCALENLDPLPNVISLRYGYSVFWLMFLYAFGAYVSKYDPFKRVPIWACFLVFAICAVLTSISRTLVSLTPFYYIGETDIQRLDVFVSYTSPTVLLGSVFMFCAFSKFKFKRKAPKKIISFLCPMALGVYLIHCHPVVVAYMTDAFTWIGAEPIAMGIGYVIINALIIFGICLLIDWIRLLLFKLCRIKRLSEWLEKIMHRFVDFLIGESRNKKKE